MNAIATTNRSLPTPSILLDTDCPLHTGHLMIVYVPQSRGLDEDLLIDHAARLQVTLGGRNARMTFLDGTKSTSLDVPIGVRIRNELKALRESAIAEDVLSIAYVRVPTDRLIPTLSMEIADYAFYALQGYSGLYIETVKFRATKSPTPKNAKLFSRETR